MDNRGNNALEPALPPSPPHYSQERASLLHRWKTDAEKPIYLLSKDAAAGLEGECSPPHYNKGVAAAGCAINRCLGYPARQPCPTAEHPCGCVVQGSVTHLLPSNSQVLYQQINELQRFNDLTCKTPLAKPSLSKAVASSSCWGAQPS